MIIPIRVACRPWTLALYLDRIGKWDHIFLWPLTDRYRQASHSDVVTCFGKLEGDSAGSLMCGVVSHTGTSPQRMSLGRHETVRFEQHKSCDRWL